MAVGLGNGFRDGPSSSDGMGAVYVALEKSFSFSNPINTAYSAEDEIELHIDTNGNHSSDLAEERLEYELLDGNESPTRDVSPDQSSAALQPEEGPLGVNVSIQIERQTQDWQPFTTDGTVAHQSTREAVCVPKANPFALDEEKRAAILGAMKNFSLEYAPQWAARLSDQQLVQTVDHMTSRLASTEQNRQPQSS